jgi:hypothetical protein
MQGFLFVSGPLNCFHCAKRKQLKRNTQAFLLGAAARKRSVHYCQVRNSATSKSRDNTEYPTVSEDTERNEKSQQFLSLPEDFDSVIRGAFESAQIARQKGHHLIEIEFPALSAMRLSSADCGAYEVFDANRYHAVKLARMFASKGDHVAICVPDGVEYERVVRKNGDEPHITSNIRWSVVQPSYEGNPITSIWVKRKKIEPLQPQDTVCIILGVSCQELKSVEKLIQSCQRDDSPITFILFNVELDKLRSDLGLLGFPSKELQYRFLCRFLSVYYWKSRSFVKFLSQQPFLLKYEGALFRTYPNPWQVLLQTGDELQRYRRIASLDKRPTGVEFRQMITQALVLEPSIKEQISKEWEKSKQVWWEQDEKRSVSEIWKY